MDLLPGDIGLQRNNNLMGWAIRVGDGVWAKRHNVPAEPYNHALVYTGFGAAVQGEPGGANKIGVRKSMQIDWYRYIAPLTDAQREAIADAAKSMVGTPYNWLDIGALTLRCLGWNVMRRDGQLTLIGRRLARGDRLVCSALADAAYFRAGFHLFNDGRVFGEVTPGDLARSPMLERVA